MTDRLALRPRKLEILSFWPLREAALELGRLQVLVGPNGSGKSWVLRAQQFLSLLACKPLRGPKDRRVWGLGGKGSEFSSLLWRGRGAQPEGMIYQRVSLAHDQAPTLAE